jgi:polyisoprenyl-teichoic acid--peptidoglycan teichoic acid transferase
MASPGGEKPYRLYRGGRVKGRVPTEEPRKAPPRPPRTTRDGRREYRGPGPRPRRTRRTGRQVRWGREIGIAILLSVLFFIVWGVLGYLAFRGGVSSANKRLPRTARTALAPDKGALFSNSTSILLLGTDHSAQVSRVGDRHSDSITLLHTDPKHGRLYYLSIPRDLLVGIPGYSTQKVNAAYQIGGPRLAIRTVSSYTGIPINHVIVVDFAQFRDLIDKIGGIDVVVPRPIISKFDCPYAKPTRCARWKGWRFPKGKVHLNGKRALIYSRVRKNALDPSETDITRGERNQQVLQAVMSKLAGFGTYVRMPFIGGSLLKPLATDLSANQFIELGWNKFRSGTTIHCRLGGSSTGGSIAPSEDNAKVILMVLGKSAVQPPAPTGDTYPPGCLQGNVTPSR